MRKALLVVLCLLLATAVFAQMQSGPSNKVGYVKIVTTGTPGGTGYTAFGLPFEYWEVVDGIPQYGTTSNKPSDIVGGQATGGSPTDADKISQQGTGTFAVYTSTPPDFLPPYNWVGGLESGSSMVPGRAYYFQNKSGSNMDLVLAGEVNNSGGYGVAVIPAPPVDGTAYYAYSWRDSRNVPREDLDLTNQGFQGGSPTASDKLSEQGTGAFAVYTSSPPDFLPPYNWVGGLTATTPGRAYYIQNKYHGAGDTWNYDYPGDGSAPASRQITDPTERTITKVTPSAPATKSTQKAGKVRE
jgi:hypothetical protein